MKNLTIRFAAAALAALAALACSKNDTENPVPGAPGNPDGTPPFTITASIDAPAETRISMTDDDALRTIDLKWKTGDKIYVVNGDGPSETVYTFTATTVAADGKTAAFTAPDGYSGSPMYAIHRGINSYSSFNPKNVNATVSSYNANISSLPNGFPLYGKYDESTRRISFKPLLALLKLAVTFPPEAAGALRNLRIYSVSGDEIFYSDTYNITGESPTRAGSYMNFYVSYSSGGSYTAETTANLYIPIRPGAELSNQKLEIILQVGDCAYSTIITGGNLETGKCYPLTLPAGKWSGGKIYEGGNGSSADNPYQIKNEINLRALAKAVKAGNYFSGKYFRLENSISGIETSPENPWLPIGTSNVAFNGNFDGNNGNNCTVSGTFHLSDKNGTYLGFFGSVSNGTVSNLTINGDIIFTGDSDKSSIKIGGIAGYSSSPLTGCTHTGSLTVENTAITKSVYAGGIVGEASKDIVGCTQSGGTITVNTPKAIVQAGGVCGYFSSSSASMHTSRNESNIAVTEKNSSDSYVGALVGRNAGTVYSCSSFLEGITITVNDVPQDPVKAIGFGYSGHTELDTTEHTEPAQ